jgi:glycosyltransferase involved in cell wall biosynthesis
MPEPTKRPLRILHIVAASDAGGVSRYLLDLSLAMRALGHEITIAGQAGAWHDKFTARNLKWIDIPLNGGPPELWQSFRTLRDFAREHPVDLIHTHYRRATWLARRLQRGHSPPILYTLHLSHMPLTWGRRWFTDFGDHLHVASTQAKQWALDEKLIEDSRVSYIPHGVDPDHFPLVKVSDRAEARERWKLPRDATVAAYVGRLDYPKNEEWLLDVVKKTNVILLVAGTGPHETDFRRAIENRRVRDRVRLLGELQFPLTVYQAADAVLLPSLREGFSYVNAEAMSVGVPMLRTQTSGSVDLIEQDVTGKYVPIDRDAFVKAAVDFLGNRERLRDMGLAAADRLRKKFTFASQLEKTLELYQRLNSL